VRSATIWDRHCAGRRTRSPLPSPPVHSLQPDGRVAQIKANWEAFFSGTTPAARKIALLQNGQEFAAVIQAQAASGLAKSASATVTAVHVISATQATVTYDIYLGGKPALSNQTGTAVHQDGTWKVGDVSFCQLLALENGGKAPAACSSVG
jgi:hypothetical protein